MTGRDVDRAARLRAETARITAEAQARLADLVMPPGATRTQRAEIRAARRRVWADRQMRIKAVTAVLRGPTRAQRSAANKAAHQTSAVPQAIRRRRADRQMRRLEQAMPTTRAQEEQGGAVRRVEAVLYRREGETR